MTLPEIQWLATQVEAAASGVVGVLITDDGVDLANNEIEEIQWMKKNTVRCERGGVRVARRCGR